MKPVAGRHVWLDGRLVPEAAALLSVSDRGFQLGDGVFETLRARRGVVIDLDEHLARLLESAAALRIALSCDADALATAMTKLLAAEGLDGDGERAPVSDAALRITVSRGSLGGRSLLPPDPGTASTVAIQAWPFVPPAPRLIQEGVRAVTSSLRRDPSSPLASVKTTSRADHVWARLEAARLGADDAIHLTLGGGLAEATTANLWLVSDRRLLTPPLSAGILAGTTRGWLLAHARELASQPEVSPAAAARAAPGTPSPFDVGPAATPASLAGLDAAEADLWPADLHGADEAFLTASVSGIVPLVSLDGRPIGSGRPGPLTLALRSARERWIDAVSKGERR